MEQGPEQKISFDQFLTVEIGRVESFEKLYELIDRAGEVGKIGENTKLPDYAPEEVRASIETILQKSERGEEILEEDFQIITRAHGIRDAVMRLLNQQALNKAA